MRLSRGLATLLGTAAFAAALGLSAGADAQKGKAPVEDYVREPVPPGVQVINNEFEGPVFADANGKTLYRWPLKGLRNGSTGDQKDKPSNCGDTPYTVNSGLMSPYPPGLELPDVATRPSCTQQWPPFLAAADAKPVGKWTVVERTDGKKQWSYDGWPIYTSALDHKAGDVIGGTRRKNKGDAPVWREPISPRPNVPSQFAVYQTVQGRLLGTSIGFSVYSYDKDGVNKSNCVNACLTDWTPMEAPEYARAIGEFSIFERTPGIRQWAFRGKPLYTSVADSKVRSFDGGDVPGWHNVFTQPAPTPPKGITRQDTRGGEVYADAQGRTLYIYYCGDDALDQLTCDHPDTEQAYRIAICGGGDVDTCNRAFQYVIAPANATGGQVWHTMDIDPKTGHRAKAGDPGALHVWTYRDRPIYTFFRDQKPGDLGADSWGEFYGKRNGFKAFWVRDPFRENAE
jgi:predicted lipoprotein with Yx(FWY)xxD motif